MDSTIQCSVIIMKYFLVFYYIIKNIILQKILLMLTHMMINSVLLQHRIANEGGGRALSTSSVRLCDKKNNVASSNLDDKTNADKVVDPAETSTSVEQKAEDDSKFIKMAEQNEEPVVSKTDDGSTTQMVVKTERLTATPKQGKANVAKSGKEGLLDLLGAMKVEVTNKRKLKNLKFKQSYESMPMSKPAAMESTISMFQQATEEASSRR